MFDPKHGLPDLPLDPPETEDLFSLTADEEAHLATVTELEDRAEHLFNRWHFCCWTEQYRAELDAELYAVNSTLLGAYRHDPNVGGEA